MSYPKKAAPPPPRHTVEKRDSFSEARAGFSRAIDGLLNTATTSMTFGSGFAEGERGYAGESGQVATYLLRNGLYLTALEFMQELCELGQTDINGGEQGSDGGIEAKDATVIDLAADCHHGLNTLQQFFNDPKNIEKITLESDLNQFPPTGMLPNITSPFQKTKTQGFNQDIPAEPAPLHAVLAEKDRRIALLEYDLRCARDDMDTLREAIGQAGSNAEVMPDQESENMVETLSEKERRLLNCLVSQYLKDTGCKVSAMTMQDEVLRHPQTSKQDLNDMRSCDLHIGNRSKLVAWYRHRVAPVQSHLEIETELKVRPWTVVSCHYYLNTHDIFRS
jgi:hypothetical protein